MGLSIYYSGNLAIENDLGYLIAEVKDICEVLEWRWNIYEDIEDANQLKGISFAPKDSEPVFLTFLPGGRLCSPINLVCRDMYDGIHYNKELMFSGCTKTQYAGPEAHIAIIKLLRYISEKYLQNFNLTDEGNYSGTGDERILYKQFSRYNIMLNLVGDALSGIPGEAAETVETLIEKIERVIKEKLKDKGL